MSSHKTWGIFAAKLKAPSVKLHLPGPELRPSMSSIHHSRPLSKSLQSFKIKLCQTIWHAKKNCYLLRLHITWQQLWLLSALPVRTFRPSGDQHKARMADWWPAKRVLTNQPTANLPVKNQTFRSKMQQSAVPANSAAKFHWQRSLMVQTL